MSRNNYVLCVECGFDKKNIYLHAPQPSNTS